MSKQIKKRLTTPSTLIAVIALVFAMSGGAYAASRVLITSTKQISPKVLKALTGKAGPAGKSGASGAQGPAGPQGPQGPAGANGTNGSNGKDGASVTSAAVAKGNGTCKEGGSEFKTTSGTTFACNGEAAAGGGGLPKTLASGATEKGVWSIAFSASAAQQVGSAPISFDIPLAAPLLSMGNEGEGSKHVFFIGFEEGEGEPHESKATFGTPAKSLFPNFCKGTAANPEAVAGNLCVFAKLDINAEAVAAFGEYIINPVEGGGQTAGALGAVLGLGSTAPGLVFADGTWAVTAE